MLRLAMIYALLDKIAVIKDVHLRAALEVGAIARTGSSTSSVHL